MELNVYNIEGKEIGNKVTLNDAVFGIAPNDHAIYLDVKQYMANRRQGTHKSKQRNEISGSTRKLIKQKGGGGARRGDINSPLLVGGARVFGPVPRDYSFKLNKKLKQLARKSALTYKALESAIVVVDSLQYDVPKTKSILALMENLKVAGKKPLIILPEANKNVYLSARNLQYVNVTTISELNTYKILNAKSLIIVQAALDGLDQIFKA